MVEMIQHPSEIYGVEPMVKTPIPEKKEIKSKRPSNKKSFDICDPVHAKDEIIYILKTTGDKIASENEVRAFLSSMMESCQVGAAKGAAAVVKPKRQMSGWNCYLKTCSQTTNLSFPECMQDKDRKNKEYVPNKPDWNAKAKEGCPI